MDVNLQPLVADAVADFVERTFRPVADQKDVVFEVEVEDALPTLVTDEQRLQQVLKNLLSNAFKFTEHGSVTLSIATPAEGTRFVDERLARAPTRCVAFAVTDTGIGISDDKLKLIFEAFQQADGTTSRRYGGTGLGLSISREIARLLGGEIQVVSQPGAGSTFTLFLPTASACAARRLGADRAPPRSRGAAGVRPEPCCS